MKFCRANHRGLCRDEWDRRAALCRIRFLLAGSASSTICLPTTSLMFKVARAAHQWPSV